MTSSFTPDPWSDLRRFTTARIALGRAGGSVPTHELLAFQMHHARAVDAVYTEFDRESLAEELGAEGINSILLDTRVGTREEYLQRPDYGRRLSGASRERLERMAASEEPREVVLAVVDGLSATAVHRNALAVVSGLYKSLSRSGHSVATVPLVRYGRVALQDEIASIMKADLVVSLIGERPGLGSPDSLGAYLVFNPRIGNTDANRNCVSNIRPEGLPWDAAIETLHWLITESLRRKISGIELKDDRHLNVLDVSRGEDPKLS